MLHRIQLQAGFIEFAECRFDDAKDLFTAGGLDIREVNIPEIYLQLLFQC